MSTYSLAEALEWRYGPVANLKQLDPSDTGTNPKMVISKWRHQTEPEPTEAECNVIMGEYTTYRTDREATRTTLEEEVATEIAKPSMSAGKYLKAKHKLEHGDY